MGNKSNAASVCLDLAYLPSGFAASTVDVEFFRHVRSSCYIISGEESYKDSVMKPILESLLEGKVAWPDIQVSYNSTYANVSSFYFRHVSKKNRIIKLSPVANFITTSNHVYGMFISLALGELKFILLA